MYILEKLTTRETNLLKRKCSKSKEHKIKTKKKISILETWR